MVKRTKILIGILAVVVVLTVGWLVWNSQKIPERLSYERCLKLEDEISEDISSIDNSCEIDSDCKPLNFGGNWVNICVNKNTNTLAVQADVKNFLMKCPFPGVWPPIKCSCVENKCDAIIEKPQEVTITTDKTEYEQGEEINFGIKNNSGTDVFLTQFECSKAEDDYFGGQRSFWPNLQTLKDNKWNDIDWHYSESDASAVPCRISLECVNEVENVNFSAIETNFAGMQLLPVGKYRIKSELGESCERNVGLKDIFTVYSPEFTIKEKSATDPRCGQRVKFSGACESIAIGFEFDSNSGKCVKKNGNCHVETPFTSLEECQKVCENK
ncbi:MAG: hypothetical protein C0412_14835 [Flavobacterium sp.]|nr:hypothetical protein [Flavobacterium sp.]